MTLPKADDYYPLLEYQPNGCGSYGADEHVIVIDEKTAYDLYSENAVDTNLPLYEEALKEEKVFLVGKTKLLFHYKDECKDFIENPDDLLQVGDDLSSFDATVSFWLLTGFFIHSSGFLGGLGVYYYMKSELAFKR